MAWEETAASKFQKICSCHLTAGCHSFGLLVLQGEHVNIPPHHFLGRLGWLFWSPRLPSGKRLHNYGKSPFFMGKSTISMAIFTRVLWHLDFGMIPSTCRSQVLDFSNDCCILVDVSTSRSKVKKIPFPKWSNGFQFLGLLLGLPHESYLWKCSDFISALKNL